jgi:hypothetical protein
VNQDLTERIQAEAAMIVGKSDTVGCVDSG